MARHATAVPRDDKTRSRPVAIGYVRHVREPTARIAGLVALVAAMVLAGSLLLPWWQEPAAGRDIDHTAWAALPEAKLVLAVAVASMVLVGLAFGLRGRTRLRLSVLVPPCALAALAIAWRRWSQPPESLAGVQRDPAMAVGLVAAVAMSASAVLLALMLRSAKRCADCAEHVGPRADICPHCGFLFEPGRGRKRCPDCKIVVKAKARVCRYCGHRFDAEAPVPEAARVSPA
jgi:hypothetical protein